MKINPELGSISNSSNIYSYLQKPQQVKGENPFAQNSSIFQFKGNDDKAYTHTENKASELRESLNEVKEEQGFIGKAWDGIKGLFGGGSKKIEKQIEKYEKGEISYDEVQKSIDGYKEGQKMSVDVVADLASGIISVMSFALAVPTGGASLVAGAALATVVGAGVKVGVKALDAKVGGREYSNKDFWYDTATGAINGLLAPITNGIGACVTKSIGQKLGLTVLKEGTEEIITQGAKTTLTSLITTQGVKVSGGSLATRAAATAAGMAVDGSLGGAADNAVRAAMNGENVLEAAAQGAIGGLILAPVIGGGFKVAGKVGHAINNKLTVNSVLPDASNISFGQGLMGDCALLSTLDGMLHNPQTMNKIKNSITQSIDGSYNVTIGGRTVKVLRDALTDDMLSDKTGIRIFEQAYKQLAGELDGGFADVVAREFGLNPVHINPVAITDDTLDLLAKEKGNGIFSFGTKVDPNGNISLDGTNHYFNIRDIDPVSKKVVIADPYNTAKTIELSYDDVKRFGLSIDGGTIKASEALPHYVRNPGDLPFYGYELNGKFVYIDKDRAKNVYDLLDWLVSTKDSYYIDAHGIIHCAPNEQAARRAWSEFDRPISVDIDRLGEKIKNANEIIAEMSVVKRYLDNEIGNLNQLANGNFFNSQKIQKFMLLYSGELTVENFRKNFPYAVKNLDDDVIRKILSVIDDDGFAKILDNGINAENIIKQQTDEIKGINAEINKQETIRKMAGKADKESFISKDGDGYTLWAEGPDGITDTIKITLNEYKMYQSLLDNPKYAKLLGDMENIHAMHRLIQRYGLSKNGVDISSITRLLDDISDVMENPATKNLFNRTADGEIHFPALGFLIKRGKTSRNGCALILSMGKAGIYDGIILNKEGRIITVISGVSKGEIDNSFCQILEKQQLATKLNDNAIISDDDIYNLIDNL